MFYVLTDCRKKHDAETSKHWDLVSYSAITDKKGIYHITRKTFKCIIIFSDHKHFEVNCSVLMKKKKFVVIKL